MSVCDHLVAPDRRGCSGRRSSRARRARRKLTLPDSRESQPRLRGETPGAAIRKPPRSVCAHCPRTSCESRCGSTSIGDDQLSGPVTGNAVASRRPYYRDSNRGDAARVPMMIGTNRDEFTLFVALQYLRLGNQYTAEQYPQLLRETFGANAAAVGGTLSAGATTAAMCPLAYSAAVTDGVFACAARSDGRRPGEDQARVRLRVQRPRRAGTRSDAHVAVPVGASHSLELRYLFDIGGAPPLDPAQQALSDQMIDYWASSSHGPPNRAQPDGRRSDAATRKRLSLQPDGSASSPTSTTATSARSGRA